MNKLFLGVIFLLGFLFTNCDTQQSLIISKANSANTCAAKDGYWYKDKCWADFEDDGIAVEDIDQTVEEEMKQIEAANIYLNGQAFPIQLFFPFPEGKNILFLTVFEDQQGAKSIIQEVPMKKLESGNSISTEATLLSGNIMQDGEDTESQLLGTGPIEVTVVDMDNFEVQFSGKLTNEAGSESYEISMKGNEALGGAGNSTMEVKGTEVHINGDLGTRSYHQLSTILREHPEVKTAVLGNISGSVNDAVNMHTGRILHEAGLTTKVLADSEIASGGVDLFCAGVERIVQKGAKIGIHSWCCLNDLTAAEIPQDHPVHQYQLEYFTMCMGKDQGPAFYFHTLTSASFEDVHWMSDEDIVKWKVATQLID